jgi:hypothetical protein
MAALQYVHVPGYSALILRRTYAELMLSGALADRSKTWFMGTNAKWNESRLVWTFPTGATIQFGYLDHEDDRRRYFGPEWQMIGFDELTQFREEDYRFMFSRLRKLVDSPVPIRMRGASNPGGRGHDWVKARFITKPEERVFIPAKLNDNPYLDKEDYVQSLLELPANERERLLDGNWDAADDGLLSYEHLLACSADCEWPDGRQPQNAKPELFIGVDQGRARDLSVVWTWERIGDVLWCRECFVMDRVQPKIQKEEIKRRLTRWVIKCGIDEGAQGWDLAHELEREHPGIVEGVSLNASRQGQIATMLHGAFQDHRVRIPDDDTIRRDFRLVRRPNVSGESPKLKTNRDETGHADRFWAAAIGYWLASGTQRRPTRMIIPHVVKRF